MPALQCEVKTEDSTTYEDQEVQTEKNLISRNVTLHLIQMFTLESMLKVTISQDQSSLSTKVDV